MQRQPFGNHGIPARLILCVIVLWMLPACSRGDVNPTPVLSPAATVADTPPPLVLDTTALENYTHSTNRFSLRHPATWDVVERPDGVIILEPEDRAGYSVVFKDVGQPYTEEQLNQYLVTFVAQNFFNEQVDFQPISQRTEPDGTVIAQFSSVDPNLGLTTSEVRVMQEDTIVFVIHMSAPEAIWQNTSAQLKLLADTFTHMNTEPEIPPVLPTSEPEWVLIGPKSQEFGFLYADDWDILEQQENVISVGHTDTDMIFTASKFRWPNAAVDSQAAKKAAQKHIEDLSATYDSVRSLPVEEFPVAEVTGATIDFLYTDDAKREIAGSVITAVNKGQMHKIVFTAPADIYDAALVWFNPMQRSFTFLSPDAIETEEP